METNDGVLRVDLSSMYGSQPIVEQSSIQEKSPEMIVEEHIKKVGELSAEGVINVFDYEFFKEILESYIVLESGLIHFDVSDQTKEIVGMYVGNNVLSDIATFIHIYSVNRTTQLERDLQSVPANGNSLVTGGNGTIDEMTQIVLKRIREKLESGTSFEELTQSQKNVWTKYNSTYQA